MGSSVPATSAKLGKSVSQWLYWEGSRGDDVTNVFFAQFNMVFEDKGCLSSISYRKDNR